MKNLVKLVLGIAASSALDGTLNARDLKNNKKKAAFALAKTVGWTIVQNHPAFILAKLVFWGVCAFLVLVVAGIVTWMTW